MIRKSLFMVKRQQQWVRLLITAMLATTGLLLAAWVTPGPQSLHGVAKGAPSTGQPNLGAQRTAMSKLGFLIGQWSGPLMEKSGPGPAMHLVQSEDVQPKLDGLVLLVEGRACDSSGRTVFQALATISYDDSTSTYRFRAYSAGQYLDTKLSVVGKGFSWGYTAGPATIGNTMRLTPTGEWSEKTTTRVGTSPPRISVEMTLHRIQLSSPGSSGHC